MVRYSGSGAMRWISTTFPFQNLTETAPIVWSGSGSPVIFLSGGANQSQSTVPAESSRHHAGGPNAVTTALLGIRRRTLPIERPLTILALDGGAAHIAGTMSRAAVVIAARMVLRLDPHAQVVPPMHDCPVWQHVRSAPEPQSLSSGQQSPWTP